MHKKVLHILLLLFVTIGVSSQSFPAKTKTADDSLNELKPNSNQSNKEVLKKNAFPTNQKVSPEIFYILNDKPVSREEYIKQNKKKQEN